MLYQAHASCSMPDLKMLFLSFSQKFSATENYSKFVSMCQGESKIPESCLSHSKKVCPEAGGKRSYTLETIGFLYL